VERGAKKEWPLLYLSVIQEKIKTPGRMAKKEGDLYQRNKKQAPLPPFAVPGAITICLFVVRDQDKSIIAATTTTTLDSKTSWPRKTLTARKNATSPLWPI
jgi:hypothetical protein